MNQSLGRCAHWCRVVVLIAVIALGAQSCLFHRGGIIGDVTSITASEIDSVHATDAYDAVRKLRPQFLAIRGRESFDPKAPPAQPNVYVDQMFYGDISTLRGMAAGSIETIRFYNAAEAQYAFGRGNMAGVISIVTKH